MVKFGDDVKDRLFGKIILLDNLAGIYVCMSSSLEGFRLFVDQLMRK